MKYKLILFIILTTTLLSCGKKKKAMIFSMDEFPIESGSEWTYTTLDPSGKVDTLVLRAVEPINSSAYFCHIFLNKTLKDFFNFKFPLREGDGWGFQGFDSVRVTSYFEEYGGYEDVFRVERNQWRPNYSLSQELYIAPSVGIIEHNIIEFAGAPIDKANYKLIDYKLK